MPGRFGGCCTFSKRMSYAEAPTSDDAACLASCHPRFVSYLCHFFGVPPVASRTDPDDGVRSRELGAIFRHCDTALTSVGILCSYWQSSPRRPKTWLRRGCPIPVAYEARRFAPLSHAAVIHQLAVPPEVSVDRGGRVLAGDRGTARLTWVDTLASAVRCMTSRPIFVPSANSGRGLSSYLEEA
jgi:hypothetical protein